MPARLSARLFFGCCLLSTRLLAAQPSQEIPPSMDFLEYLGGVEAEIDGRLSSPVELDLEAFLAASGTDTETGETRPGPGDVSTEETNHE